MPLGVGQAAAARPGRSPLLGHRPALKELWLNEMSSCSKASLEMSQGNSGEAQGLARLECPVVPGGLSEPGWARADATSHLPCQARPLPGPYLPPFLTCLAPAT